MGLLHSVELAVIEFCEKDILDGYQQYNGPWHTLLQVGMMFQVIISIKTNIFSLMFTIFVGFVKVCFVKHHFEVGMILLKIGLMSYVASFMAYVWFNNK